MGERDELKMKGPRAANPNPDNSSKSKEEGELSTSSDDNNELPGGSTKLDGTTLAQKEPVHVAPVKKNVQLVKTAKSVLTSNPSKGVGAASRSSVLPNYHKKFEKNRVPFVISFSDDDSGSDSEECGQGNAYETKNVAGVSGRHPAASFAKLQTLPGNARKGTTMGPRKVSLSHTFVSSMTKDNVASSNNGNHPILGEKRSHVKHMNILNKNKAVQEHGCNQNVHLNSSKLQDLRQLIAIRENELKLKAAKQNKESASGSCKTDSATNLGDRATRIRREAPGDSVHLELKEPDKKRLKVGESHSCKVNSDGSKGIAAVESNLALEKSVLEHCDKPIVGNSSCCDKEVSLGTTQWQNEEENRGSVLASNLPNVVKEGTNVIPNSNQCNRIVKFAGPSATVANRPFETCPKKSLTVELRHPIERNLQPPSRSIQNDFVPNKARHVHNSSRSIELHEVRSEEKAIEPVSKDAYQSCSGHIPDNNLETFGTSLNNLSFWNSLGNENLSGTSNMDIQTLMEVEELQDKELEEAQERRRKCEAEERNALKAYRKAQRAVMEANSRCSYLYRKRELFSANFRSLMMDNPSMFWSSRLHDHLGMVPNSSNNMPEVNMHVGTSNQQMESDLCAHNQCRYNSNVKSGNVALQNLGDQHEDQHEDEEDLASNPCSEPDASTSNPQKDNAETNAACSQSSDLNMSVDEGDETFPIDQGDAEGNSDHQKKEEKCNEKKRHAYNDLRTLDSSQDSLLLEASLRSQLFARLGIKNPLNDRRPGQSSEPARESSAQDDSDDNVKTSMVNLTLSEAEKDQPFDLGGSERDERTISELPVQIKNKCHVEKFCSNYGTPNTDPLNNCFSTEGHRSVRAISFLYPILRSTFGHVKVVDMISLVQSHTRCQNIHPFYVYDKMSNGVSHYAMKSISMEDTSMDICFSEVGSYSCNPEIDPLWPLCMFELRGKCNDDECTRQHVRNHSYRNMNNGSSTDDQVMASSLGLKSSGAASVSRSLNLPGIAPPSYVVCADILKADLHTYKSVLAQTEGRYWQKSFSAALVLSSLLPTSFPSDEPFLHGPGARIESYGSWNRQSSYFHSRHGTMSQLNQHLIDNDEFLETALLSFSQEANKQKGRIEALKVLARSLEADPKSAVLWIVYLHIYYSNQKSIGKDDMFNYAVEHNEESYELWLMYINSREQLDDKLVAYDNALLALSLRTASPDRDAMHASECILDLFLQMIHTLCISGKVDKAIDKICGFFPSRKKSDEPQSLFLTDVLACLTIWDKCIFWVCCVYLVIYKKLPDAVVLQFECQKQLTSVEWVSTHLTVDEKQQAVNLMEMAVDSLALYIDGESLESETTLKAAHLFALNHVRCIAVLEGLECSRNLLDKYIKLYPSCLELVLMAARAHELEFANWSFVGFEEALSNWLEEVPGVQCIWNQYAEYALQNGRCNFVKELMDRWFHSVWKCRGSQLNILDNMDGDNSFGSPDSNALIFTSGEIDVAFGLLNLSLYKLLQSDHIEARSATDRALKCASAENYKHCVREHAMFWLTDGSPSKEAPVSEVLKILNQYIVDTWAFPATELLSRKFIQTIKKPRVQQLVSNLFSPVSVNCSLVNLVLEVWYGPSLLPIVYDKERDLVDLVEAIMEMLPANYQLAVSLCKLLSKTSSSAAVTSSISFWASSILVNALFQTVPVAPEYIWVEAASVLHNLTDIQSISLSFHKRALSVHPFSMKLWESYLNISRITGDGNAVIEAARSRGIDLY